MLGNVSVARASGSEFDLREGVRDAKALASVAVGGELSGRQTAVCSRKCKDARYQRLHPEEYTAKERRKYERRRNRETGPIDAHSR